VCIPVICSSCTTVDGTGRYRIESIGNAQRSIEATVISVEPAYIRRETTGAGAALGGTTGGAIAYNNSDNAGVIIAGIIGGAIVGNYVEGMNNVLNATEYVIQTSTGAIFTVAQVNKGHEIFVENDNVILVYGYPARLIRDPR
jgi:outer membrane lipoprotein SlyB